MKVLKFGGTSVGTPKKIKSLVRLIDYPETKIVVLSAMSGTTDALVEITRLLYDKNSDSANAKISELEERYIRVVDELFVSESYKKQGRGMVESHFSYIRNFTVKVFTKLQEKAILAQGELISTALLHFYLLENEKDSVLIPALNFMRIDKDNEPDYFYIRENLERELKPFKNTSIIITQGYICRNAYGEVDNLKRGGSDYTASLIGAALDAKEIQIWTDINGFHNNDPRFVKNTTVLRELSFDEAAELAYFGAKILHPTSVLPCKEKNIPVRLKNTMIPEDPGTLITGKYTHDEIKAVAAKDCITVVKVKSDRMLLAYGFLRKIFEIFEIYKTPIDMITTSEVAVSLTIDDTTFLKEIEAELNKFGQVEIERDKAIICVIGDFIAEKSGSALKIMQALKDIPLRMISYGGSRHNISVLVNAEEKVPALNALSGHLFKK
ncbi:MAG: aspartate kinase [Calditrichaceae bacterium]